MLTTQKKAAAKKCTIEKITEAKVLDGLAKIAFADDESIKPGERLKALELIGRHLGIFDGSGKELKPFYCLNVVEKQSC